MRTTETKVIGVVENNEIRVLAFLERNRLLLVEQYVLFSFVSVLKCFLKRNADFLQKFITFRFKFHGFNKGSMFISVQCRAQR